MEPLISKQEAVLASIPAYDRRIQELIQINADLESQVGSYYLLEDVIHEIAQLRIKVSKITDSLRAV